jgi:hypothetical protein
MKRAGIANGEAAQPDVPDDAPAPAAPRAARRARRRGRLDATSAALAALSAAIAALALFWPQLSPHMMRLAASAARGAGAGGGSGSACPLVRRGWGGAGRLPARAGVCARRGGARGAPARPPRPYGAACGARRSCSPASCVAACRRPRHAAAPAPPATAANRPRARPLLHLSPLLPQGYTSASGASLPAGHPPVRQPAAARSGADPSKRLWVAGRILTNDPEFEIVRSIAVNTTTGDVIGARGLLRRRGRVPAAHSGTLGRPHGGRSLPARAPDPDPDPGYPTPTSRLAAAGISNGPPAPEPGEEVLDFGDAFIMPVKGVGRPWWGPGAH